MKKGSLDGIRVVEITLFQQGPVAGMRLGDLGAEVIKVEPPAGDPGRGFIKVIGAMAGREGNNYYFEPGSDPGPPGLGQNYFIEVPHPEWGALTMPGFPWNFSETPASCRLPAPGLGEHTDEILSDLGLDSGEIQSLRNEAIIK